MRPMLAGRLIELGGVEQVKESVRRFRIEGSRYDVADRVMARDAVLIPRPIVLFILTRP